MPYEAQFFGKRRILKAIFGIFHEELKKVANNLWNHKKVFCVNMSHKLQSKQLLGYIAMKVIMDFWDQERFRTSGDSGK